MSDTNKYMSFEEAYDTINWTLGLYLAEQFEDEDPEVDDVEAADNGEIVECDKNNNKLLEMVGVTSDRTFVTINEGANIDAIKIVKELKKTLKENSKQIKGYLSTGNYAEAKKAVTFAKKEINDARAKFNKIDFDSIGSLILGNYAAALQSLIPSMPFGVIGVLGYHSALVGAFSGKSAVSVGAKMTAGSVSSAVAGFIYGIKLLKDTIGQIRLMISDAKKDEFSVKSFNAIRSKINAYFDSMVKVYDKFEKVIEEESKKNKNK